MLPSDQVVLPSDQVMTVILISVRVELGGNCERIP